MFIIQKIIQNKSNSMDLIVTFEDIEVNINDFIEITINNVENYFDVKNIELINESYYVEVGLTLNRKKELVQKKYKGILTLNSIIKNSSIYDFYSENVKIEIVKPFELIEELKQVQIRSWYVK